MTTQERETKTLTTPSGKEIVLKTYLTARERKQVREALFSQMKGSSTPDGEFQVSELPASVMIQAEEATINATVASYDGSAENVLPRLLDSKTEEYDFVLAEVNRVSADFLLAKTAGDGAATSPDTQPDSPRK